MPELPEVETITRALRDGGRGGPSIVGKQIKQAQLLWHRTLAEPDQDTFLDWMPGKTISAVSRRGKYAVINVSDRVLLIHLRMSGDLRVEKSVDEHQNALPLDKHDRAVIDFIDGYRFVFMNPRKFGRMWLLENAQKELGKLGPEPLSEAFTSDHLFQLLQSRHRQLKPLLLDQTFIAGMGNIYTDEALHLAGIHPLTLSDQLNRESSDRLWKAIREVLWMGIENNGSSIDWVYRGGSFQNTFRVYQQTGKPCPVCGHEIEKILVGQRGTHFCGKCQPLNKHSV
jgi:formamidopyrimidine-DNA glycosylase